MAALVRSYWKRQGFEVAAAVCDVAVAGPGPSGERVSTSHYRGVRSDLVNGLPRSYRGELGVP